MQRLIYLIFLFLYLRNALGEDATIFNASDTVLSILSAAVPKYADLNDTSDLTTDTIILTTTDATRIVLNNENATPLLESVNKTYYISDDVPRCSEKDVHLNECIKNAFEFLLPRIKDGNKEFNIPSVEPFAINRTVYRFRNGPVDVRLIMKNAMVYGFLGTKILDVKFKFDGENKYKFRAKLYMPRMNIVGDYKAVATFNGAKLKPQGAFNLTINEINIDQISDGDFYQKDGHTFMRLENFDVRPTIGNYSISATGVFPDPNLNELVLGVINRYWRQIYAIMLPETKQYWAPMLMSVVNQAMSAIPYDLVVKDINENRKITTK